jgi:hypothetical protein
MSQPLRAFLWGFGGSLAVEILLAGRIYYTEPIRVPARYKRFGFYVFRFLWAVIGGGLALGYQLQNDIAAANVGAAAPAIVAAFSRGLGHVDRVNDEFA